MIEQRLRRTQVDLCYGTSQQAQLVTLVNGIVLVVFLRTVIDTRLLVTWFAALVVICVLRIVVYVLYRRSADPSQRLQLWESLSWAGAALAGLLWGSASVFLFAQDSIVYQVFLAFIIAGITAGGVTTLSVQLPAALVFLFFALAPLALRFAFTEHAFAAPMALMVALFMAMMMVAATRFFGNLRSMLEESLRRESAEQELKKIAYYDPLTGLPNRRLFADYMQRALATARRHDTLLAACYLDLDNFKPINDRYGHQVGDRVLAGVAQTLQNSVRGGDVIARWGGDEFAILLTNLNDVHSCELALKRLNAAIAAGASVDGHDFVLSASIGAALGPHQDDDADTLMRHADLAMYEAKHAGRNRHHIFDPQADGEDTRRNAARQQLRRALHNNELLLHFQPKVEMGSGRVYGAEALIRWHDPERGVLPPGAFLPQWEAEEHMVGIDRWVIRRAITQLDEWLQSGLDLILSVNVSAWLLDDDAFIDDLRALFEAFPRTRGKIEIEVTETRALNDISRICEVMALCAPMQVEFALDDFGTGFSSLVHLQRLPASTLKIDTSFVIAMLENDNDRKLVKGIIGLGDALGKAVVAEGVETVAHGDALLAMGCRYAQGYGIARPMSGPDFVAWMSSWRAPPSWRRAGSAARAAPLEGHKRVVVPVPDPTLLLG